MPLSSCAKAAFQAGTLVYHFLSTETWTCDRQLFSQPLLSLPAVARHVRMHV